MDDNKKMVNEIAARIRKVREQLGYSQERMAAHFGITRSAYVNYESALAVPRPYALYILADTFDISLDWLLAGKGPMFYKARMQPEEKIGLEPLMPDVREMLEFMERIPLLRYQVLSFFQEFKLDHKDLLESATISPEESERREK